jgi:propanol-preferring alcohol dehydrogenase
MKAMILQRHAAIEDKPLRMADLTVPAPEDDQVLIKVSACGLCHTDLDTVEGRVRPARLPIVPGHQVVGTVAEKGKAVKKLEIGRRVGVTWLWRSCGACRFCTSGSENLCARAKWTGKDADGGYAEYMVVGADFAYPIPERFSDSKAAPLLCAGVIGYRTFRLADIRQGDTIGIFGFGASAHIVIQIIKHRFPNSAVFVFTRSGEHRKLAKQLGAAWADAPTQPPPEKIDKAMDFTPVGETVRTALSVMEKGGRLVINTIQKTTPVPPLDYAEHLWHEKQIQSVANVTRSDAEEFLPLAAEIPIEPVVQEFELAQANEALIEMKHTRINGAAVLRIR